MNPTFLRNFIYRAKTSVRNGLGKGYKLPSGEIKLIFQLGNLKYVNICCGKNKFSGREIVFYDGKPIWSLIYYGGIVSKELNLSKLYSFLKLSISQSFDERYFLKQSSFANKQFSYKDHNNGDIENFEGKEVVSSHGEVVYFVDYAGGLIN